MATWLSIFGFGLGFADGLPKVEKSVDSDCFVRWEGRKKERW